MDRINHVKMVTPAPVGAFTQEAVFAFRGAGGLGGIVFEIMRVETPA
jgi:hypothetical protein